jgi:hypothetical protein
MPPPDEVRGSGQPGRARSDDDDRQRVHVHSIDEDRSVDRTISMCVD